MNSFFGSGPLPDWKELQRWLGNDIPWKLAEKWNQGQNDSSWLNEYIKDILKNSNSQAQTQDQDSVKMDAVKDARYVNVTIRLTPQIDIRRLQLFATADRLKLTGLPEDKKRVIRLPCLVYPRSGKAESKDGHIIVRFKRRPPEKSEYELFIHS